MKSISHSWLITFIGNILFLMLGIANSILLGRFLQPEGRGTLAAILFWPHFIAGVGVLSINESITYRISLSEPDSTYIRSAAIWLSIYLSILNCLIALPLIPYLLGNSRQELSSITQQYAVIFIPFSIFSINFLALDQGSLDFIRYNFLRLMQPLLYLLAVSGLWTIGHLTVSYVVYAALCTTVATTFSRVLMLRDKDITRFSLPVCKEARRIISTGLRFQITNLLMFGNAEADKLIILLLLDNSTLGVYMVALAVASTGLGIFTQTFTTVIFPYISKFDSTELQYTVIARTIRYSSILLIICNTTMAILSQYLIPLLFGKAYQSSVVITALLSIAFVFKGIRKIMIYNLRGIGKTKVGTLAEFIALSILCISTVILFNIINLAGIVIIIIISDIISVCYLTYFFNKAINLSIKDLYGLNISTLIEILTIVRKILQDTALRFRTHEKHGQGNERESIDN